jgi:hypothetical protein
VLCSKQISLAKSLSTRAELLIRNSSEGCQIDVTVSVSASVPWPMQSTIEALMADQVSGWTLPAAAGGPLPHWCFLLCGWLPAAAVVLHQCCTQSLLKGVHHSK